jgi:ABC-type glutathione transport system ATPase component
MGPEEAARKFYEETHMAVERVNPSAKEKKSHDISGGNGRRCIIARVSNIHGPSHAAMDRSIGNCNDTLRIEIIG